jgi:hypothetical protein
MVTKDSSETHSRGENFPVSLSLFFSILSIWLATLISGCIWNTNTIEDRSHQVEVLFIYEGQFQSVCLGGDFNDWSPDTLCLERTGETWKTRLLLSPGRYKYAFILDGTRWTPDPNAFLLEDDGFGMKNSVLIVD